MNHIMTCSGGLKTLDKVVCFPDGSEEEVSREGRIGIDLVLE